MTKKKLQKSTLLEELLSFTSATLYSLGWSCTILYAASTMIICTGPLCWLLWATMILVALIAFIPNFQFIREETLAGMAKLKETAAATDWRKKWLAGGITMILAITVGVVEAILNFFGTAHIFTLFPIVGIFITAAAWLVAIFTAIGMGLIIYRYGFDFIANLDVKYQSCKIHYATLVPADADRKRKIIGYAILVTEITFAAFAVLGEVMTAIFALFHLGPLAAAVVILIGVYALGQLALYIDKVAPPFIEHIIPLLNDETSWCDLLPNHHSLRNLVGSIADAIGIGIVAAAGGLLTGGNIGAFVAFAAGVWSSFTAFFSIGRQEQQKTNVIGLDDGKMTWSNGLNYENLMKFLATNGKSAQEKLNLLTEADPMTEYSRGVLKRAFIKIVNEHAIDKTVRDMAQQQLGNKSSLIRTHRTRFFKHGDTRSYHRLQVLLSNPPQPG